MKILAVTFATAATIYNYTYAGDVDVEVGDYGVANKALVTVKNVIDEADYKPTVEAAEIKNLKPIEYVISRKGEREEFKRQERIKVIKASLSELQKKAQLRRDLEGMAADGGAEGKKLLAELESLEGKI